MQGVQEPDATGLQGLQATLQPPYLVAHSRGEGQHHHRYKEVVRVLGRLFRFGQWFCRHEWMFTNFGKIQFKTCKHCGRQLLRSDDSEEWTTTVDGLPEWRWTDGEFEV